MKSYYKNYDLEELASAEYAAITDATQRLLLHLEGHRALRGEIGAVRETPNPYVRRLHILIYFEQGTFSCPRVETVWIDDFELVFLLIDDY